MSAYDDAIILDPTSLSHWELGLSYSALAGRIFSAFGNFTLSDNSGLGLSITLRLTIFDWI
jgi:type III secretory pathway component EscV